jgi:hypothetical protein
MARTVLLWLALVNCGPVFNEIECLLKEATSLIGIREQGGNNRGPVVDKIITEAGGKPGQAWCSYTMIYIWKQCGVPHKGTNGMAMSWAKPERRVPERSSVRPADVFTIYNKALKRIGHVGMVYKVFPEETFFQSFEGNVNFRGDRESVGSGAKCLMREYANVNGVYRWTK